MDRQDILDWLRETNESRLDWLWRRADDVRRQFVGDAVHLRGLVEISSHCVRHCAYCGLRAPNSLAERYRMSQQEILNCARVAMQLGYGTIVLQAGEDPGLTAVWVSQLIQQIKTATPLAVTLSLGERTSAELAAWRGVGADRYLLRFETSNRELYEQIHPPGPGQSCSDRIAILRALRQLGYEVGSGVMAGLPGQTYESLARDITLFADLDLDMIGSGPYLKHPDTPLANNQRGPSASQAEQVPADELMGYKLIALSRLACPQANIPSTTALATLNRQSGYELGLQRGANVVMPNLTPPRYRSRYQIYPGKASLIDLAEVEGQSVDDAIRQRIEALGRSVGTGRGDSRAYAARLAVTQTDEPRS